jgi:hypothetical protein
MTAAITVSVDSEQRARVPTAIWHPCGATNDPRVAL